MCHAKTHVNAISNAIKDTTTIMHNTSCDPLGHNKYRWSHTLQGFRTNKVIIYCMLLLHQHNYLQELKYN